MNPVASPQLTPRLWLGRSPLLLLSLSRTHTHTQESQMQMRCTNAAATTPAPHTVPSSQQPAWAPGTQRPHPRRPPSRSTQRRVPKAQRLHPALSTQHLIPAPSTRSLHPAPDPCTHLESLDLLQILLDVAGRLLQQLLHPSTGLGLPSGQAPSLVHPSLVQRCTLEAHFALEYDYQLATHPPSRSGGVPQQRAACHQTHGRAGGQAGLPSPTFC